MSKLMDYLLENYEDDKLFHLVDDLEEEVSDLKEEVSDLKEEVEDLENEIDGLNEELILFKQGEDGWFENATDMLDNHPTAKRLLEDAYLKTSDPKVKQQLSRFYEILELDKPLSLKGAA